MPGYLPVALTDRVRAALAPGHDTDGISSAIIQTVALQDLTTRQTKASAKLLGVPAAYPTAFGPLTTVDGAAATLGQLSVRQIYVNQVAAQALSAHAGDRVDLFIGGRRVPFDVRAVLRNGNLAAGGLVANSGAAAPEVLLPLRRLQALLGQPGRINAVLISNRGDAISGAALTGKITGTLWAPLANPRQVATAASLLRTPQGQTALRVLQRDHGITAATRAKLRELQGQLAVPGQSTRLVNLLSDKNVGDALKAIKTPAVAAPLSNALAALSDYSILTIKQDALDGANTATLWTHFCRRCVTHRA